MAGITLTQAQAKLDTYLAAQEKIIIGQKVEIDGEALTRANFVDVERAIDYWDKRVRALSATASGQRRCVSVSPRW